MIKRFLSLYDLIQGRRHFFGDMIRYSQHSYVHLSIPETDQDLIAFLYIRPRLGGFPVHKNSFLSTGFVGQRSSFYDSGVFQILVYSHGYPLMKLNAHMILSVFSFTGNSSCSRNPSRLIQAPLVFSANPVHVKRLPPEGQPLVFMITITADAAQHIPQIRRDQTNFPIIYSQRL